MSDLLKTVGVKVEEVKSSPLKAAPNGYEPTSPEARAALDSLVKDSYAWFRGLVKDRRNMDDATLQTVADGRVFTGRQAVGLKLIDQLGDEKTAVAWLVAQKKVGSDVPVKDFRLAPRFGDMTFLRATASVALDAVGLGSISRQLEQSGVVQAVDRFGLDGIARAVATVACELIGICRDESRFNCPSSHCGRARNNETGDLSRDLAAPHFELAT